MMNTIAYVKNHSHNFEHVDYVYLDATEKIIRQFININNEHVVACFDDIFNGCKMPEIVIPAFKAPRKIRASSPMCADGFSWSEAHQACCQTLKSVACQLDIGSGLCLLNRLDHAYAETNNSPPPQFIDKIIAGDAEKVLHELPDNCVDLVFTSPPYNFGLDYGGSGDDIRWEEYFQRLFAVFDECIRVLKFGGRIVVNVQPLFSDYIPSHHIISSFFMQRHLIWKGELLWEKNNYNCKYTAWGSWKSPASPYLKYTWEFIEIFAKGSLKSKGDKADADITADEFKQWVNAKWSIAPERNMRHYGHPAMFPEELAVRVLKLFSFAGSFVLDPFAGVGTTAVAAQKLHRHYLGIDISPQYCQTAEARLAD